MRGRGAGHAADFGIERSQVLQGDGSEHAALLAEWQVLLGFERGVQAGGPAAVLRDAALELIHRFDGAVLHHVIDIAAQKGVGVDRVVDRGVNGEILLRRRCCRIWKCCFRQVRAGVGQSDVAAEFVKGEIEPAVEAAHQWIGAARQRLFVFLAAREHQRDARFVDEDGIGLVDDRRLERPVNLIFEPQRQIVAQIVEADFVGSGIGDIAGVRAAALFRGCSIC